MVPILRDAGLSFLIDPDAELERLAGGFEFTEGPLWLPDDSLLFQDIKAERTYRLGADGVVSVFREGTGAANGQTFDADEHVVVCEQNGRRVSRMALDGSRVETPPTAALSAIAGTSPSTWTSSARTATARTSSA